MSLSAVLLLAGYEKQLSPLSDSMHQSLLRLGNKTQLELMLDNLSLHGVSKAILVVGHYGEKIVSLLGERYADISITYVWNRDYLKTNVMYSLWLARHDIVGPFLILDGDVFCEDKVLSMIVQKLGRNVVLVDSSAPNKQGSLLVTMTDTFVRQIGRQIQPEGAETKARCVGIYLISDTLAPKFFDLIDKLIKLGQKNLIYEDALNALVGEFTIEAVDIAGKIWKEMDSLEALGAIYEHTGKQEDLEIFALNLGADTAVSIDTKSIVFDPRTRLLCFNCGRYGKKQTCPPHIPDIDYQTIIQAYSNALLISVRMNVSQEHNFETIREMSTNSLHKILLLLEKSAFRQNAYYATSFIGGSCKLCQGECGEYCRHPQAARIPMEAAGIDVIRTAEKAGIHLRFPALDSITRIGILLIS
jgi:predicted metal-binding protein/choline kinase